MIISGKKNEWFEVWTVNRFEVWPVETNWFEVWTVLTIRSPDSDQNSKSIHALFGLCWLLTVPKDIKSPFKILSCLFKTFSKIHYTICFFIMRTVVFHLTAFFRGLFLDRGMRSPLDNFLLTSSEGIFVLQPLGSFIIMLGRIFLDHSVSDNTNNSRFSPQITSPRTHWIILVLHLQFRGLAKKGSFS